MTTQTNPQTYNGWTNWETWNAMLWLLNDEANYAWWTTESARQQNRDIHALAQFLSVAIPTETHNADLTTDDWENVNWKEVAQTMLEEVQ